MVAPLFAPGGSCAGFTILRPLRDGPMPMPMPVPMPVPIIERYIAISEQNERVVLACARRRGVGAPPDEATFLALSRRLIESAPPEIPRVVSAGTQDGIFWIASELLEGAPLDEVDVLASYPTVSSEDGTFVRCILAITIGQRVGAALSHLAEDGLLHGALHPRMIWLTPEPDRVAYLLEAGYAQLFGQDHDAMLADPMYRAPEQLNLGPVDHRADIYSLGLLIYAQITGEPPFKAASPAELLERCRRGGLPPLTEALGALGSKYTTISAILARATAVDPADRYQDWDDFVVFFADIIGELLRLSAQQEAQRSHGATRSRSRPSEGSPPRRAPRGKADKHAPKTGKRGPVTDRLVRLAVQDAYRDRLRAEVAKLRRRRRKPTEDDVAPAQTPAESSVKSPPRAHSRRRIHRRVRPRAKLAAPITLTVSAPSPAPPQEKTPDTVRSRGTVPVQTEAIVKIDGQPSSSFTRPPVNTRWVAARAWPALVLLAGFLALNAMTVRVQRAAAVIPIVILPEQAAAPPSPPPPPPPPVTPPPPSKQDSLPEKPTQPGPAPRKKAPRCKPPFYCDP